MSLEVTAIMIGVQDLSRAKKFYGEGLGCRLDQDYPHFVSFKLGDGSSSLALYQWEAAAQDAGVPASSARAIICRASAGLVANAVPAGMPAAAHRAGSVVHERGRYSSRSISA